jgi:signal transduction histidine kinase
MSSAAFLTVGLFALFIWGSQRRETFYLLIFFVSLASFVRTMHYYVGENHLLVSDDWFSWLTVNSLFWLIAAVHFFLNYLHRSPKPWLNQAVIVVTLGMGILSLPFLTVLPDVYVLSSLAYIFLMCLGTVVGITGLYQSRKMKSRDGMLLGSWCLIGMIFWLYDWLLQSNRIDIENIYMGPYTNLVAFLLFLKIIFKRYVGAVDEVRQLNASLEQRLQAREAELLLSHQNQREITQRQMLTEERQRMMQDMHDGMGSSLLTALLGVEKGRVDAKEVADVLKGCIDDLKLAIDAMEPVQADLLLLLATLRFRLGPRLESAGLMLHWEVESVPALAWIDHRNALHILRILQEAFANVIKHTKATQIRLTTAVDEGWVVVTISDNGQGFDFARADSGSGKGLGNQRRRAQSIGAEILWDSSAAGTRLSLRLPVQRTS